MPAMPIPGIRHMGTPARVYTQGYTLAHRYTDTHIIEIRNKYLVKEGKVFYRRGLGCLRSVHYAYGGRVEQVEPVSVSQETAPKAGDKGGEKQCFLQSVQWSSWENTGMLRKAEWPGRSTGTRSRSH